MKNFCIIILIVLYTIHCQAQKPKSTGYVAKYTLLSNGNTKKVSFVCLIPDDIEGVQKVTNIKYSISPKKIFKNGENKYAEFILESLKPKEEIIIDVDIDLFRNDFKSSKKRLYRFCDSVNVFLDSERHLEKEDENIIKRALELKKNNTISTIKSIYRFVNQNFVYTGYVRKDIGAAKALKTMSGDCTEFTDLFVTLCRANNIPARVVEGFITEYGNTPKHSWAEVHVDDYGWIRLDPTPNHAYSFNTLMNKYIQLSTKRNDEVLQNYHHWKYDYWGEDIIINEKYEMK